MKTKVLMFILMIMCFCTSCVKEDDTTEAQAGGNETKSSVDEAKDMNEVESETIYEYWKDDDIVWLYEGWSFFEGNYEYGKVAYDGTFDALSRDRVYEHEDKLFAVCVKEGSGKTAVELYENYVKPMNVKTEFDGMEEDEIINELEKNSTASILIFLTKEEVLSIVLAGCPDDMMIKVTWCPDFKEKMETN